MPKRKTADANAEAATVPDKKRSPASKSKAPAAATHKRTNRMAKAEVAAPVVLPVERAVENSVPATLQATAAPAQVPQPPAVPRMPTREEIALLAYSYWENRGYQGGSTEEDWFRAERELLKLAQDR